MRIRRACSRSTCRTATPARSACSAGFRRSPRPTAGRPARRRWAGGGRARDPRPRMKLATWNVNSLKMRMPRVLELLEQYAARHLSPAGDEDRAGRVPGHRARRRRLPGRSTTAPAAGRASRSLARRHSRSTNVCAGLEGEPARDEARWIEADVDGVRAVSVYVPNGQAIDAPAFADKLRFLEAIAERVPSCRRTTARSLIAGDFNVCRTDLDVYDPAAFVGDTHVTDDERTRFEAILDAGLVDTFRALHPDDDRLHVVGLPRRATSTRASGCGSTRCCSPRRSPSGGVVRDRARLPQGQEALRPRTVARRTQLTLKPCAGRPMQPSDSHACAP